MRYLLCQMVPFSIEVIIYNYVNPTNNYNILFKCQQLNKSMQRDGSNSEDYLSHVMGEPVFGVRLNDGRWLDDRNFGNIILFKQQIANVMIRLYK